MRKLAIITTHPIQYHAPWFRLLAQRKRIILKVFYTWGQLEFENKFDPGFGKNISWDIPLLEGYEYTFVTNRSKTPGSHHYKGIDNPGLIKLIQEWSPDSILVFGWRFKSHLNVLRYFKGKVKILFRGDSTLLDEAEMWKLKKYLRKKFLGWVYRHVDVALYAGSANKRYYLKNGLREKRLIFAPHAIDNCRFMVETENTLKKDLGIASEDCVFLFAGKFEAKKNPMLLLNAFIRADLNKAHLLFIGNGELENALKIKVAQQKSDVQKKVHFMDFQNQSKMPQIYSGCDVFVLPSQGPGETWGLSVNEAMASGKAVLVSSKCGCVEDLVQDGKNGFSFISNDEKDLIDKLKKINRANVQEMGEASQKIIQNWSFKNVCQALENAVLS